MMAGKGLTSIEVQIGSKWKVGMFGKGKRNILKLTASQKPIQIDGCQDEFLFEMAHPSFHVRLGRLDDVLVGEQLDIWNRTTSVQIRLSLTFLATWRISFLCFTLEIWLNVLFIQLFVRGTYFEALMRQNEPSVKSVWKCQFKLYRYPATRPEKILRNQTNIYPPQN